MRTPSAIAWCAPLLAVTFLQASCANAAVDLSHSITGTVSDSSNNMMAYRLFRPQGYDIPGKKFPLILFLHGVGERGSDATLNVTSHIDGLVAAAQGQTYPAYILAPQIPAPGTPFDKTDPNPQWVSFPYATGSYHNSNAPAESAWMKMGLKLVEDTIASSNIDPTRVYVTGLSIGGYGTWDALVRDPGRFAAAVPMSGAGNLDTAALIKDVPIWDFHGSADTVVPVSGSRTMINALIAAGGTPKYTELAGQGHVIWGPIYGDALNNGSSNGQLYPWLFSQSIPEPGSLSMLAAAAFILATRRRSASR